jgi:hypothetical protein
MGDCGRLMLATEGVRAMERREGHQEDRAKAGEDTRHVGMPIVAFAGVLDGRCKSGDGSFWR